MNTKKLTYLLLILSFYSCIAQKKATNNENWKVKIKDVIGRIATDTNPTIIGYVAILAFCEQTKLELNPDLKKEIDNFVFKSWENGNDDKIPNFTKLNYEK